MTSAIPENTRIFISHSQKDNEYCRAFVAHLRQNMRASLPAEQQNTLSDQDLVWFQEQHDHVRIDRWIGEVAQEIMKRRHFVVMLSPESAESPLIRREIGVAVELAHDGLLSIHPVVVHPQPTPQPLSRFKLIAQYDGKPHSPQAAANEVARDILNSRRPEQDAHKDAPQSQPVSFTPAPAPVASGARPVANSPLDSYLTGLGFREWETGAIAYILPPPCAVPAGPATLGADDPDGETDEPLRTQPLDAFFISRYPVTVAEYSRAVVKEAVRKPVAGSSAFGQDWETQCETPTHPVVGVSWNDAMDYAEWLRAASGQPWRLPTEDEWEKAARSDSSGDTTWRRYPWGTDFSPERCNTRESGESGPTEVGRFHTGASPLSIFDMAGNVWEWTNSVYHADPRASASGSDETAAYRVLRGGSWYYPSHFARTSYRQPLWQSFFLAESGFRLALDTSRQS